ncbi:hypothetical protein [Lentibacillus sediminis]|uniref:hypothetical protein n=1 Tax=Lentibacillus sediminis TaxID=1940529 RepID=UPI000C1C546B|nr:hypothetical protein [Lentibacillus sediminis]
MKHFIENIFLSFRFDMKTMGVIFFVPVVMFAFSLSIIVLAPGIVDDRYNNIVVIQGLFIPFSCWWILYRLSEMYEEGAQETLVPYYSKRFPVDFFRYFFLHVIGLAVLCSILIIKYDASILTGINVLHFIILTLFYMLLGTSLIVLIKNVEISLTIIMIYTVLEVITQGDYMPWPHVFLFDPPINGPFLPIKLSVLGVAVIVLMVVTLIFIRRADKKPK